MWPEAVRGKCPTKEVPENSVLSDTCSSLQQHMTPCVACHVDTKDERAYRGSLAAFDLKTAKYWDKLPPRHWAGGTRTVDSRRWSCTTTDTRNTISECVVLVTALHSLRVRFVHRLATPPPWLGGYGRGRNCCTFDDSERVFTAFKTVFQNKIVCDAKTPFASVYFFPSWVHEVGHYNKASTYKMRAEKFIYHYRFRLETLG